MALSLHAVLGTLLLITALSAVIRSSRSKATPAIALTAVALLAIVVAWLAGSDFVGHHKNSASLAMAFATAVAILCYTLTLFLGGTPRRSLSNQSAEIKA